MNLQDITTSLEISKKLKEKGFKQDTIFFHTIWKGKEYQGHIFRFSELDKKYQAEEGHSLISSPTAEEILKELPNYVNKQSLEMRNLVCGYYLCYKDEVITDDKLCNALAKMWLYLKDNNLLEDK